ncbi:hypothetical protein CFP66_22305 [Pseudonocardia sp. MH-G8]|nr:hypothetical protein CFP66_22305 [Pseudonocardia sp. MH-G8]
MLGAGPTGLEFAGQIAARWPDEHVTVLDPAQELLPRFPDEFRAGVHHQLDELGVELLLGTGLSEPPATAAGERSRFRTTTTPSSPTSGSAASGGCPPPGTSRALAWRTGTWR